MGGARANDRDGKQSRRVFDDCGHLTPLRHAQLRDRLNATGIWSAMQQSELLAQQLGHADQSEIWAMLMWNARPSPTLAARLQRWFAAGMPLSGEMADSGGVPLAKAS